MEESVTLALDHTWRCLWSYSAHQIIRVVAATSGGEQFALGAGWGLRDPRDPRRAILLHPSGADRATGDLSLTIPGVSKHVIPRYGAAYADYLAEVAIVVATVAGAYLAGPSADDCQSPQL